MSTNVWNRRRAQSYNDAGPMQVNYMGPVQSQNMQEAMPAWGHHLARQVSFLPSGQVQAVRGFEQSGKKLGRGRTGWVVECGSSWFGQIPTPVHASLIQVLRFAHAIYLVQIWAASQGCLGLVPGELQLLPLLHWMWCRPAGLNWSTVG